MIPYPINKTTLHAPPERLSDELILEQAASLGDVTSLLDCVPDLAMILNEQRQIIFANHALQHFAGAAARGRLLGMRPGELLDCREAACAPSGCGTGEACRTCGAVNAILCALAGASVTHDCRISTTAIDAYDLRITASPFKWSTGGYVLMIATDISNEKRRLALERIFFHDILNTAGNLQSISELILSNPADLDIFKQDLHDTATALVSEIRSQNLLLSAERNELVVTLQPVSIRSQFETIVHAYQHRVRSLRQTIVTHIPPEGFLFRTDPALLQRVIGNLLINAIEAGSPDDQIELGAEEQTDRVIIWCHNPKHIPRAIQLQLFQRSFTTKGTGRGLGTYSVRLLTERYLKGRVTLVSEPKTGTCFELSFPKAQDQEAT